MDAFYFAPKLGILHCQFLRMQNYRLHLCCHVADFRKCRGKAQHISPDFLISDSGVYLSRLDIGMPQHLRYRLDGHTICESHRCGKGVAGEVKRNVLVDAAHSGEFFQITVGALIRYDREYMPVSALSLVLLDYRERIIEKRHVDGNAGFFAGGS